MALVIALPFSALWAIFFLVMHDIESFGHAPLTAAERIPSIIVFGLIAHEIFLLLPTLFVIRLTHMRKLTVWILTRLPGAIWILIVITESLGWVLWLFYCLLGNC